MRMRVSGQGVGAAVALATLSVACDDRYSPAGVPHGAGSAPEATGASVASGGQSAIGGAGTTGDPFAGAPPPAPLDVRAPSDPTECDPEICTVVSAWDMVEADTAIDEFFLVTSADTAYVTLTSSDTSGTNRRQRFVALDASGDHPIDGGALSYPSRFWLAVGANGTPRLVGTLTTPAALPEHLSVEEYTLNGTTWSRSVIENGGTAQGFEIDPTDRSRVHFVENVGASFVVTREAGAWTSVLLPNEAVGAFALDVSGQPIFVSLTERELVAIDDAGSKILSRALPERVVVDRTANFGIAGGQPQAIVSRGADFGVALLLDSGLHVLLVDRASSTIVDVPIPNTRVPAFSCRPTERATQVSECVFECRQPCTFSGSGLAPLGHFASTTSKAFALARSADGAFWLAYVISELEVDYSYQLSGGEAPCTPCGGCSTCLATETVRESDSTLHVIRITPDGTSVRDALTVRLGEFMAPNYFLGTTANGVRMRSFGQHVAVAVAHRASANQVALLLTTFDALP